MAHPNALHGDGINFAFFNLLWSKSSSDEDSIGQFDRRKPPADGVRTSGHSGKGDKSPPVPILRVPDTVVFLFGQPHQWYFTSKNGGPDRSKTTILRKRRANLTLENIAEVFLNKSASRGGAVGEDDVVAYFINSSSDATEKTNETDENARPASLDACNSVVGNEVSCNIEYLNKKTLRKQHTHKPLIFIHIQYSHRKHHCSTNLCNALLNRGVSAAWKEKQERHPSKIHCATWRRAPQFTNSFYLDTQTLHSRA